MRQIGRLVGAGLVGEAIYLALALRLPWWRYGGSLSSWSAILGKGPAPLLACLAGIGVLFATYWAGWTAIRGAGGDRRLGWIVWIGATAFAVTLIWVLPITSDLFTYLTQAHLRTDLGLNPFVAVAGGASTQAGADMLAQAYPAEYNARPSVYGPAWVLLSLPATLGRYDVAWGLFYLKALAAMAAVGCAWLAGRIALALRRGSSPPVPSAGLAPLEAVYLLAWNPLLLLLGVGDGHNDLAMMALVLLSIYFLFRERWLSALAALTFAVWVKYVAALLVPLLLYYAWQRAAPLDAASGPGRLTTRRLGGALGRSAAVVAAVSALVLAPFGQPGWLLDLAGRLLRPANAPALGMGVVRGLAVGGLVALGLAELAIMAWLYRRHARPAAPPLAQDVLNAGLWVMLLAFVLEAARAQPWHLIWPLSLAGLATCRVGMGRKDWIWPWPLLAGLSAVLLAGQVWIEWGLPGI